MAPSYTHDELLKLRGSPLVCKPASLPPVEEWMGPVLEQNQGQTQNQRRTANRSRNEDGSFNEGVSGRRPPLESKGRSTNLPEDIILGPPKTSFASASGTRHATKTFDSPHRTSFSNQDDGNLKNDRSNHRDRISRDGQRDGEQVRDTRAGATQNRRSAREDNDMWSHARQQKIPMQEDGERSYRKNGDRGNDRDKDGPRENRTSRGFDNHRREVERETDVENGGRRPDFGRGRNEPSWYRDDSRIDDGPLDDLESTKKGAWRDKERRSVRGSDREWNRGGKPELDPEWMDTPEPEQKNQSHTQEDFERWKERMKTGNAAKVETPAESRPGHDHSVSNIGPTMTKGKIDTPLVLDASADGFFGLWNEPKSRKPGDRLGESEQPAVARIAAKASKSSKFTGFFNPKPETETVQDKPSLPIAPPPADSSNEDKEGFQRILSLLGQQQQQPKQDGGSRTPPRAQQAQREHLPEVNRDQTSKGLDNNDLSSLFGLKSPQGNAVSQNTDSEFLLKLMQQPRHNGHDITPGEFNGRRAGRDAPLGALPFSNLMISPQDALHHLPPTGPPPGFFDDMPNRDKLNPGAERRGPPLGFFGGNVPRQSAPGSQIQSGTQRPPGLDQLPSVPPGYAPHISPQRQNMAPPPGFQVPPRGQSAFPPGLLPNDRPQFGIPSNGRGMPPPGFVHPAPPGFSLPFGQEGMPFGAFDSGAFGQGYPSGQRRQ